MVLGIVKTLHEYWYWYWVLLKPLQKLVLVLGIVKASLEKLGIGIGVKKWYCSCLLHMHHMTSIAAF